MKTKIKSILMILCVSAVVIFGIYFASCRNGKSVQFVEDVAYESAVYSDMVLEESVSLRTSNTALMAKGFDGSSNTM